MSSRQLFCTSSLLTEERKEGLQLLSDGNTESGENDRKWVTMRNAELAAETRLRLNIGLPEQRPNPFRDKCRVSEAHLLCGLRFNNWHYNSISHHYLAVWRRCRDGGQRGKRAARVGGRRREAAERRGHFWNTFLCAGCKSTRLTAIVL